MLRKDYRGYDASIVGRAERPKWSARFEGRAALFLIERTCRRRRSPSRPTAKELPASP